MTIRAGTPLQAIKFAQLLSPDTIAEFLQEWISGDEVSHWRTFYQSDDERTPQNQSFADFCASNPDEDELALTRSEKKKPA